MLGIGLSEIKKYLRKIEAHYYLRTVTIFHICDGYDESCPLLDTICV